MTKSIFLIPFILLTGNFVLLHPFFYILQITFVANTFQKQGMSKKHEHYFSLNNLKSKIFLKQIINFLIFSSGDERDEKRQGIVFFIRRIALIIV